MKIRAILSVLLCVVIIWSSWIIFEWWFTPLMVLLGKATTYENIDTVIVYPIPSSLWVVSTLGIAAVAVFLIIWPKQNVQES